MMQQHNIWCVYVVFCVERYVGPTYLSTQNATYTYQMLCCCITTIDLHNFVFLVILNSVTLTKKLRAP